MESSDQTQGFFTPLDGHRSAIFPIQRARPSTFDLTWEPDHTVASNGTDVWIKPYVFFGRHHDSSPLAPEIQRPFVILGGMDQTVYGDWKQMYAELSTLGGATDFVEYLRDTFDVVLLTYSDALAPVQLNATALACTIRDINNRNQRRDQLVLIGLSMGGMVSRLTLSGMENSKIPGITQPHHVGVWVTIDTPHQGAYIPLRLQNMINSFRWLPIEKVRRLKRGLDSVAARQLLLAHYSTGGSPAPERTALLATLQQWGFFPKNVIARIAVSSGALAVKSRGCHLPVVHRATMGTNGVESELPETSSYATMVGGWLDTSERILRGMATASIWKRVGFTPSMPRHCFIPLWSALDLKEAYLKAMYHWLTRWAPPDTVWQTLYGSNYLGERAISRGDFAYTDFNDYDKLLWFFNTPDFDGMVRNRILKSSPGIKATKTAKAFSTYVTVRASDFDWVYFNSGNRRHGEIERDVVRFILARIYAVTHFQNRFRTTAVQ